MMADEPLFLLRAPLRVERLMQLGKTRGMALSDADLDYAAHLAFGELFADAAPAVFAAQGARRGVVEVLAYSHLDAPALAERAKTFAEALPWSTCDWDGFVGKPMPSRWPVGQRLGFQVRLCPVRRGKDEKRRVYEKDAFLVACDHAAEGVDVERVAVYLDWFDELVGRAGGFEVERRKLTSYRRIRVWRRTQKAGGSGRAGRRLERPDALFHGVLRVTDGEAFAEVLRRGIGRHRAFGFGMVLLKPPTDRAC